MRASSAVVLLLLGVAPFTDATTSYPQQQQQQQQLRHLLTAQPSSSKQSSLTVAGPNCIEAFYNTTAQHYAKDESCKFLINQAFAATGQSGCPQGGTGKGSPTHQCMQKTAGALAAWVAYLTQCPLSNVLTGGKGFSCFQDMTSPSDFESYANGSTAAVAPVTRSSAVRSGPALEALWLCAAAAVLGAALIL
ncbi:hypothetical protein OEZ85_001694 [Tetradesmus obliquus]|uniref:Secreted protein n=1 Tax=Tetradesmus obliquus TaxID=3088 RepID=A0ABY8U4R9_TETOB|nr:hypothetical protein OEZ85_001694 [Tetradesmus obliquus]